MLPPHLKHLPICYLQNESLPKDQRVERPRGRSGVGRGVPFPLRWGLGRGLY